jgi:hypothetical protein
MKRHTSICAVCFHKHYRQLKIVEGPAGTIKLPFRKLNLIFCELLDESKATPKLCASIESATFKRLPVPAAKDLSPVKRGFQESRAGFDTVIKNAVPSLSLERISRVTDADGTQLDPAEFDRLLQRSRSSHSLTLLRNSPTTSRTS